VLRPDEAHTSNFDDHFDCVEAQENLLDEDEPRFRLRHGILVDHGQRVQQNYGESCVVKDLRIPDVLGQLVDTDAELYDALPAF